MVLSVRIGKESRTILRELSEGFLSSLKARVPWCSRKIGFHTLSHTCLTGRYTQKSE